MTTTEPHAVASGQTIELDTEAAVQDVATWSVKSPHLYDILLELVDDGGTVIDQVDVTMGARTVRWCHCVVSQLRASDSSCVFGDECWQCVL